MKGYLVAYELITNRNRICYERVMAYSKHGAVSIVEMRNPFAIILAAALEDELD